MCDKPGSVSVYQQLLKHAQRVAKLFAEKHRKEGRQGAQPRRTEVGDLQARLAALQRALQMDLESLARAATDALRGAAGELESRVGALKAERSEVDRRRDEFARAAEGYDWAVAHREKRDFIGPVTVEHSPDATTLALGPSRLRKLEFPSGREVFEAVVAERERLDQLSRKVWPELRDRILALQGANSDRVVSWPELARALTTGKEPFRKRQAEVLYALGMLRSGALGSEWAVSFKPPTLSQQNKKDAVTLPRFDKPASPDRIAALRIDRVR